MGKFGSNALVVSGSTFFGTGSIFGTASYAITAAYALNAAGGGGSVDTGSLIYNTAMSTDLISGGELKITTGDNTKFDINSGSGIFVNYWATTASASIRTVTWAASASVSSPYIASADSTYVAINSASKFVYTTQSLYGADLRDHIVLGRIDHANRTNINYAFNGPTYAKSAFTQFEEFSTVFGPLNIEGNYYYASGGLFVGRNAGRIYDNAINYSGSKQSPNIFVSSLVPKVTMSYSWRTGSGWSNALTPVTNVDPNRYDNGTGLVAVPSNKWTIQVFSYYAAANYNDVQYGQAIYDTKEQATVGLSDSITTNPYNAKDVLLSWLVVKSGSTDLTNSSQAEFISNSQLGILSVLTSVASAASASYAISSSYTVTASYAVSTAPTYFSVTSSAATNITMSAAEVGKYFRTTAATAVGIQIPPQSSVTWPSDTEIMFEQAGAGQITFAGGSGVTINSSETLKSQKQYSVLGVKRVASDTWTLTGDRELV
jgi:hypothetical protein